MASNSLPVYPEIRELCEDDFDEVLSIEQENPSPWSRNSLQGEVAFSGGCALVMGDQDRGIIGWCACRIVGCEAELLKIAVRKIWRRQGAARQLLQFLFKRLAEQQVEQIFLEVRAANAPALSFYEKHGFLRTGRRARYYQDPTDDAVVMEKNLV